MKKIFMFLLLVIGLVNTVQAQNQITVSGKILNVEANKEGKRNLPLRMNWWKCFHTPANRMRKLP